MTEKEYEGFCRDMQGVSTSLVRDLESDIRQYLDRCGLFYKCFSRVKKPDSMREKIENRQSSGKTDYKLQDFIGFRVAVYFKKDIELCEKIIKRHYDVIGVSKDKPEADLFKPQRINYVCRLPEYIVGLFGDSVWKYPIDKTFEIQIRTIFSEGWHEIEHDFRYKCKNEWGECQDLSRTLNGIWATLDNCDWAIASLFNDVAYRHYKKCEWSSMIKNTLLIRIADSENMDEIFGFFNRDSSLAKAFFRIDREDFLIKLSDVPGKVPLNMKNVIFLANAFEVHDEGIEKMMPEWLRSRCCASGKGMG